MPVFTAAGVSFELVSVPPGEFRMGSDNHFFSEAPARTVRFANGFLLGKHPVTREQWRAVTGDDPSECPGSPDHPVDGVSWDRATAFCERLSELTGRAVRLPAETEWEYACRAGTTGDFFFHPGGPYLDDSEIPQAIRELLAEYAWFDLNSDGTRPVGLKRPNPWGLHDVLGNVWEWCADVWHADYAGGPNEGRAWAADADRQPRRCLRGGAWDMNAFRCRSAYRSCDHRELGTGRFGLRVAVAG